MAKVIDVYKGNDGHVWTVKLHVGGNKFNENSSKYLVRPIHKIQLLFENDEVRFPDRETEDKYNQDDESSWGEPCVNGWEQVKVWTSQL